MRGTLAFACAIKVKQAVDDKVPAQAVDEETWSEGGGSEEQAAGHEGNDASRELHPPESLVGCQPRAFSFWYACPIVQGTCLHTSLISFLMIVAAFSSTKPVLIIRLCNHKMNTEKPFSHTERSHSQSGLEADVGVQPATRPKLPSL